MNAKQSSEVEEAKESGLKQIAQPEMSQPVS